MKYEKYIKTITAKKPKVMSIPVYLFSLSPGIPKTTIPKRNYQNIYI